MSKACNPSVTHNHPVEGRQLELFTSTGKQKKPQISSIPGIPPKQRDRYRVMLGDVVIGNFLTINEAMKLAKLRGVKMTLRTRNSKASIGYKILEKLEKLKQQKRLTPCLELLEKQGISGDVAIFVLGQVGGDA